MWFRHYRNIIKRTQFATVSMRQSYICTTPKLSSISISFLNDILVTQRNWNENNVFLKIAKFLYFMDLFVYNKL